CAACFIDLDRDVGDEVLGARRAVLVEDHVLPEQLLDGIAATYRSSATRKCRLRQQNAEGGEIPLVHELGIGCDEALDRPIARFLIAGPHSSASVGEENTTMREW